MQHSKYEFDHFGYTKCAVIPNGEEIFVKKIIVKKKCKRFRPIII